MCQVVIVEPVWAEPTGVRARPSAWSMYGNWCRHRTYRTIVI